MLTDSGKAGVACNALVGIGSAPGANSKIAIAIGFDYRMEDHGSTPGRKSRSARELETQLSPVSVVRNASMAVLSGPQECVGNEGVYWKWSSDGI